MMMLSGLMSGVMGIIRFGGGGRKTQITLTEQFATAFGIQSRRFVTRLLHSNSSSVWPFGESHVDAAIGTKILRSLIYTPLVNGCRRRWAMNTSSIRIDGEKVSLNLLVYFYEILSKSIDSDDGSSFAERDGEVDNTGEEFHGSGETPRRRSNVFGDFGKGI
ncbi:hypothetical protein LINGRAHAP2_LOCUS20039 [Linum grandiflorum]